MGLISWIRGKFSRDKPQNSFWLNYFPFSFGRSSSGNFVDEISAMSNSVVFACVKVLAESVASLPLHFYRYTDNGKERAIDHKLYKLLHDAPNDRITSFVFREMLMTQLLLWGNAYAWLRLDGRGNVQDIIPLESSKMSVNYDDDWTITYTYSLGKYGLIKLPNWQILHIYGLGFDGLIGYSPIAMARNAIGLSIACEEHGSKFFSNGARPSGILKTPTIIKDPSKLRESWERAYGGSENAGKVAILEQGLEYQPISIPNSDAQFLETRRFQIEEIARIFRVPLHLLNDLSHATFSNIEHQSLDFVVHTLTPWLVRWEQALNQSLIPPNDRDKYFFKFNTGGLLRGDIKSRYEAYAIGRQQGFLSSNDIRELEDLNLIPTDEGGNSYLVNGNMMKLSQAGAAYSKAGDENVGDKE